MSVSEPIKAKRGDLAVIATTVCDFAVGRPSQEHVQVDVCEVTSVTRAGLAKAVRKASWGTATELARWARPYQLYIVPKSQIDVEAALSAAAANPWPSGHAGMPFASLDEAKAALRPHRRES